MVVQISLPLPGIPFLMKFPAVTDCKKMNRTVNPIKIAYARRVGGAHCWVVTSGGRMPQSWPDRNPLHKMSEGCSDWRRKPR